MEGNICIGCEQDHTALVIVDDFNISVCSNCGTVYILEKGLMLSLNLTSDNRLVAIATAMGFIYKEYHGDVNNAPSILDFQP